jgi:heme-degrading monooxygenase HmoA
MTGLYTSGDWHVKSGSEQAFVEAWRELAEWTTANIPGCTFAKLLQDESDASYFVSFSPWRDDSAVAAWREHPGFQERVGHLQELLESFTPRTMHMAAEAGPPTPDPWA